MPRFTSFMTTRLRKTAAAVGALAALAAGVPLVTATPAAAASCFGLSCAGADPAASGCDRGATTVAVVDFRPEPEDMDLILHVRYSATCKTYWTRAIAGSGLSGDFGNDNYAQVRGNTTSNTPSLYYRYATDIVPGRTTWTKMIPSNYWTNACLVRPTPTSDPNRTGWGCTVRTNPR